MILKTSDFDRQTIKLAAFATDKSHCWQVSQFLLLSGVSRIIIAIRIKITRKYHFRNPKNVQMFTYNTMAGFSRSSFYVANGKLYNQA